MTQQDSSDLLDPMPDDLLAIERAVSARPAPAVSAELGVRVMANVRRQLAAGRAWGRWRFALASAAALVIGANVVLTGVGATELGLGPRIDEEGVQIAAARIDAMLPELGRRDARRQAWLMYAGSTLVMKPALHPKLPPAGRAAAAGDRFKL